MALLLSEFSLRIGYKIFPKVKYFLYSSRYDLDFSKIKDEKTLTENAPCPLIPRNKINGFIVNEDGFYTFPYNLEKPQDVLRIGFVGDSFLIGVVPHSENFVNVFQREIQANFPDKKVEVINWGMPCIGPRYEEKILETIGYKAKPDYLIWMFFVGNDFTDELVEGEKLPISNLITKNIYSARLIRNIHKALRGQMLTKEVRKGDKYDPEKPTYPYETYLTIEREKLNLLRESTFPSKSWESIKQTMLRFKDNCDQKKAICSVVMIPDEIQVNKKLLNDVLVSEKKDKSNIKISYPQVLMTEYFKEKQIPFLDLLSVFQEKGESQILFHPNDTHWNIEGNKLASDEIFTYFFQ